jgi:OmpA-OmpF porin, OOP family
MQTLMRLAVVILLAFAGLVASGAVGARFAPPEGLAGGPTVLFWALGGAIAVAVVAWSVVRRLVSLALRLVLLGALVAALLAVVWIGSRMSRGAIGAGVLIAPILRAIESPLAAQAAAPSKLARVSYLTFAQGAVPVSVGGAAARLGASFEKALRAIDGNPAGYVLTLKPGGPDTDTEFVYQLPAPTTFDRFAVPNVLETPSPGETFTRVVEIHGSASGAADGYTLLATATLAAHRARGQETEIPVKAKAAVRWIKLRLVGGIQVSRPDTFFEFSEIVGNGAQEPPAMSDRFRGTWKGRGVAIELRQDGAVVTGCYDEDGELKGTVTGNLLRALGTGRGDKTPSAFVLSVRDDGTLVGVRSSNRAPFAMYTGEAAPAGSASRCPPPPAAVLGCGAVVHGINFDFDSAAIRRDSEPVLVKLFDGLRAETTQKTQKIVIEGHTSDEGTDAYNLDLSQRRAQAVAADLVKRGIAATGISAVGAGEKQPIASNADETGRSLNRRVEVHCR